MPETVCVVLSCGSAGIRDLLAAGERRDLRFVSLVDAEAEPALARAACVLGEVLAMPAATALSDAAGELRRREVCAVVTFSDAYLRLAAALAEQLGLPSIGSRTAGLVTSKFAQRAALNRAGLHSVAHELVRDGIVASAVPFPAVLKPDRGMGAAHTVAVGDLDQARAALARLPAQAMVLEERIAPGRHPTAGWLGDMVSVDTAVSAGRMSHFGVADRMVPAEPFRETGLIAPSLLPPREQRAILACTEAAITALGIDHAVVHTELRSGTQSPVVIEVNGRLGGYVDRVWARVGVGSPLDAALAIARGRAPAPPAAPRGFAMLRNVHVPRGPARLLAVPSAAELRSLPGVFAVEHLHGAGDVVDPADGWNARVLDVWIEADSAAQAAERLARVDGAVAQSLELEL